MADLFDDGSAAVPDNAHRPLADRLRPRALAEVIGQQKVLGPDAPLTVMLASGALSSLVFWGPPGVGKTTIARLLADETELHFVQISAIFSGVPELRKVFEAAKIRRQNGRGTLLFVDEIHRFNKAQQDGFLPHMEDGTILLVGATTENPSFELNAAVLSRSQVLVLERLPLTDLERLAQRAEVELGRPLPIDGPARESLLEMADGDGRALLNLIEQVAAWKVDKPLDGKALSARLMRRVRSGQPSKHWRNAKPPPPAKPPRRRTKLVSCERKQAGRRRWSTSSNAACPACWSSGHWRRLRRQRRSRQQRRRRGSAAL